MSADRQFLDTNIFVYAVDLSEPVKRLQADELIRATLKNGKGVISYQVVQEFLNVSLKKFATTFQDVDSMNHLRETFRPMFMVASSIELFESALRLRQRYKLSWYDSLIVAAALEAKCDVLYTEDLQHAEVWGAHYRKSIYLTGLSSSSLRRSVSR